MRLHNFGQTPAQNVLCRSSIWRLDEAPEFKTVKVMALQRLNRVAPNDWANLKDVIALDESAVEAVKEGDNCVWWIVHFFYSDIFGKRYEQGMVDGLDADMEWVLHEQHTEKEIKV